MNASPLPAGSRRSRAPDCYPLSAELHTVFPVPRAHTVATAEIEERVTFVRFDAPDGAVMLEPGEFSGPENVPLDTGVTLPFPPIRGRLFGYAQKRMLLFWDLERKIGCWHVVCPRLEEVITALHMLDPATFTLLFDIKVVGEPGRSERLLRTVPMGALLTAEGADLPLGNWPPNYTEPVTVAGDLVFRYSRSGHRIEALGPDLKPRQHGLPALFHDKRKTIRLPTDLTVHPTLPFAVIADRAPARNEKYVVHLAMWDIDEPRIVPMPLPGVNREGLYCSDFQFSPDGWWLVYRDETEDTLWPVFMAVPVISDKPPYLGPPVTLGKTLAGPPTSTCWIAEPLSFVACDGGALYRWKLV